MKAWIENSRVREVATEAMVAMFLPIAAQHFTTEVPDGVVQGATMIDGEWVNPVVVIPEPAAPPPGIDTPEGMLAFVLAADTPEKQAAVQKVFDDALVKMFDAKAAERNYESWRTVTLRAGYAGPFQAEGTAFGSWMDACNVYCYGVMAAVKNQQRMPPTVAQLLAELPTLTWPAPIEV
jgi:hypothetical protein